MKAVTLFFIATCVSIFLDIQVIRQILGFCFLMFVPGYLLLRLLKMTGKNRIETIVFSAGLSISLLMFIGLVLNHFCASNLSGFLGTPLLLVVVGSTFVLLCLCYLVDSEEQPFLTIKEQNLVTVLWMLVLCLLPILGIIGAIYNSSLLTAIMILAIAILFAVSAFGRKLAPEGIYPLLILSASASLLLNTAFISKYLLGADIFSEFYVYKIVETNGFWLPSSQLYTYTLMDTLNSVLSITILPAVYTSITKVNADVVFKTFYPLILSLIPLVLYRMYELQISKKSALMSVFFYLSIPIAFVGLEPLSLGRQIIGQFFFIMSILLLSGAQSSSGKRQVLLIVFGASIVVSHYSMAYIFLIYLVSSYIFSKTRIFPFRKASVKSLYLGTVILMAVLTFSWYIYVSNAPFLQLEESINRITNQFTTDFLDPSSRGVGSGGQGALEALSPAATTTLLGAINKSLVYIENLFIAIGVSAIIIKPDKFKLSSEYKLVAIASMIFLLLGFVVPNLMRTLNPTRFYAILIPFLAPFVVVGCDLSVGLVVRALSLVQKKVLRHNTKFRQLSVGAISLCIIVSILATTFFFQTGLIGHITNGYPYSYSLDLERRETSSDISIRMGTHTGYFLESEVSSATWLQRNVETTAFVYADYNSVFTVLKSYAHLPDNRSLLIYSGFTPSLAHGTYTYLKYLNVRIGIIDVARADPINISELQMGLEQCGKIYSNGDSEIIYAP